MNKELLQKLARLHIITPCGIIHLGKCFIHDGITLMAIMRFAAHHYPDKSIGIPFQFFLFLRILHAVFCRNFVNNKG